MPPPVPAMIALTRNDWPYAVFLFSVVVVFGNEIRDLVFGFRLPI